MITFRAPPRRSRSVRPRHSREPTHRERGQRSIEQLIQRLIAKHGLTDEVREHCIVVFWAEIVGAQIGAITRPDAISQGVLRVTTNTSTRLQELQFRRARMVSEINGWVAAQRWLAPAAPMIVDVRFTIGTLRVPVAPAVHRLQLRQWQRLRPAPAEIDRDEICAVTCQVEDAELRAAIERVRLGWNL